MVDGGATNSLLINDFKGLKRRRSSIDTASTPLIAHGEGDIAVEIVGLDHDLRLSKALYVPEARRQIIAERDIVNSGYTIVHNKRGKYILEDDDIFTKWLKDSKHLKCDELENGLHSIRHIVEPNSKFIGKAIRRRTDFESTEYLEKYIILHDRYGHPGHRQLVELMKDGRTQDNDSFIITGVPPKFRCETCDRCKAKHQPYKTSENKVSKPGERIHVDVAGPFSPATKEGYKYFAMIVDEYTREASVKLIKKKAHAISEVIDYTNSEERQFNHICKSIRFDNGELKSKALTAWCKIKGIVEEPTVPFEKQSNGVAEQNIFATEVKARCMMDQSKLPPRFWGWALRHAAFVRSLLPTVATL